MNKTTRMTLLCLAIAFLCYSNTIVLAQDYQPRLKSQKTETLNRSFIEYQLIDIKDGSQDIKNSSQKSNLTNSGFLQIALEQNTTIELVLSIANILSDNYKISFSNNSTDQITIDDLAKPYVGYVKGDPSSTVRLTIDGSYIYGHIVYQKKKYYIEPAIKFDKSLDRSVMIVYTEDQVKKGAERTCASDISKNEEYKITPNLKAAGSCQIVELAIAMDFGYQQGQGGSTAAINQTIAVMNMVAGSYEGAFDDDIRFEIVEHFVSTCSGCNPWSSSTDASVLLNSFTSWGPTGFTIGHDLGQLWTNRDICFDGNCSTVGLAWINAVCGSSRYHILEDFTSTAWQLRVLTAHEMGHNFGAGHDASGSQHIMAPSVSNNTTTWSAGTTNTINTAIAGFNCFDDCVTGSCSEITAISTNNCATGSPSTYSLTIEIRHGGGGTSTGFDVMVNGLTYPQSWSSSPQTVTISGLVADGTSNNSVTISANDGSDTGCAGSGVYDEPAGDCAITVIEDFNSCQVPNGWSTASTNVYTWNGGDPLVQYEWKFDDATRQLANYGGSSNATSSKTIDGTCMAIMDDDIINHDLYTGDVTLTSSVYDMSDIDNLQLRFDYNFHPFEDGGKGDNSSSFKVEVYNGSSWVNVLTDTDSTCPWSNVWPSACSTYADIDVSNYKNSNFSVRFIYSDGNDGKWTGMAALDNIEILGTLDDPPPPTCDDGIQNGNETGIDCGGSCLPCDDPCLPIVTVTPGESGLGNYIARDLIRTSGNISITELTVFDADQHEINAEFEITAGVDFTILSEGCDN